MNTVSDLTKPTDPDRLFTIISKAQHVSAPRKTYALFADIVLSSIYPVQHDADSHKTTSSSSILQLPTAATLLTRIIVKARISPDYDTIRASRWIRCLVQLCLDHHHEKSKAGNRHSQTATADQPPPLTIAEDITAQAITLARQSLRETDKTSGGQEIRPPPLYPAEELEWLSTTLFNLGIDWYVSKEKPDHNNNNGNDHNHADVEEAERAEAQAQAKKWTRIAVELADALADYPREDGGDAGLLAGVLRRKISEGLGWDTPV